jgi:predicted  nucleic acid-binding Zn-ribbon protein
MNFFNKFIQKAIVFLVLWAMPYKNLTAQHSLGLLVGDYNTPYAYSLNPALTRGNLSNRAYINWWGTSLSLDNNFMKYNAPFRLSKWVNNDFPAENVNANGTLAFKQSWLPTDLTVKDWKLNYLNEVYGPSIFIPLDNIGGFGFGVRGISGFSVNGLNGDMGGIFRYGLGDSAVGGLRSLRGKNVNQGEFSINTEKYQEWFMSFAGYSQPDVVNSMRWGFTAKLLIGMGMAHLGSDNLSFNVKNDQVVDIQQLNARFFHTNDQSVATAMSAPFGLKFDFMNGAGAGMDLGFMYEFRPNANRINNSISFCDREKFEQYKWKFGASITDLGFISYDGKGSEIISIANSSYKVDPNVVNALQYYQGEDRFDKVDDKFFNQLNANAVNSFVSYSPTALNVQFDNALTNHFHIGGYWTQSLKAKNSVGLRRSSYLSVVPRWQGETIEIGMPVTASYDYDKMNLGLYGRFGPLIVGSDNLAGLGQFINNDNYSGASFYFGFRSKIGDCEVAYNNQNRRVVKKKEQVDSQDVAKNKKIVPKDTVIVKKIVRDTVFVNNTPNKNNANISAEQIKLREAELKKKEDALKAKEDALKQKEMDLLKLPTTSDADCNKKIAAIKAEADKTKSEFDKCKNDAILTAAQGKKDVAGKQITIDQLQSDLLKEKTKNAQITAELDKTKKQNDQLILASKGDCNKQTKQLDSLWKNELAKNSNISAELDQSKIKYDILKSTCDESNAKLAKLQFELESLKAKSNVNNNCCDKVVQIEAELAKEKTNNANIKAELDKTKVTISAQADQLIKMASDKKACDEALKAANSKVVIAEDCTPYKNKAAQLELKVNDLTKSNASLQTQVTTLTADKKLCDEKLKAATAASNSNIGIAEDCTPYKNKAAQLEVKLAELNKTIAGLQSQVAMLTADKKACDEKLKAAIAANNSTIKVAEDCTPYKTKVSQLEAQVAELNKTIVSLQTQVSTLTSDKKICDEKLKAASSNVSVSEDCTPYKNKVASLEKTNIELTATNKNLNAKILELNTQITALTADKKACEEKLKAASSNVTASEDCSPYKLKAAELEKKIVELTTGLTRLQTLLDACKVAKNDLASQVDKCAELDGKLKTAQSDNAKLTASLSAANETIADLQAKLKAASASNSCEALQSLVNQLRDDVKSKNDQINQLNSDLEQCSSDLKELKDKETSNQSDLESANMSIASLRKQVSSYDDQILALSNTVKAKDAEIAKLKAQITTLQDSLKKCQDSLPPATDPGTGGN